MNHWYQIKCVKVQIIVYFYEKKNHYCRLSVAWAVEKRKNHFSMSRVAKRRVNAMVVCAVRRNGLILSAAEVCRLQVPVITRNGSWMASGRSSGIWSSASGDTRCAGGRCLRTWSTSGPVGPDSHSTNGPACRSCSSDHNLQSTPPPLLCTPEGPPLASAALPPPPPFLPRYHIQILPKDTLSSRQRAITRSGTDRER